MVQLIVSELAAILCVNPDRVDPSRSLHDMGMDSLMGVELAVALESRVGLRLPTMLLAEGPSVERVANYVVDKLMGDEEEGDSLQDTVHSLAAQHGGDVSDEELQKTIEEVKQAASDKGTKQ